jgi:hypothetical protein
MQSVSAELTPPHVEGTRSYRPNFISDAAIGSAVIAGSLEGAGQSPHPGFYSLALTVTIVALILQGVRNSRLKPAADASMEPMGTAMLRSAAWGIGVGIIVWTVVYIGWRGAAGWHGCAIVALVFGVNRFWFGRKLPHRQRALLILGAFLVAVFLIVPAIVRRIS